MEPLTKKQSEMLAFIKDFIGWNHYAPSYEEIRIKMGFKTKSAVNYHLTTLEMAGYICRQPKKSRTIMVMAMEEGEHTGSPQHYE